MRSADDRVDSAVRTKHLANDEQPLPSRITLYGYLDTSLRDDISIDGYLCDN